MLLLSARPCPRGRGHSTAAKAKALSTLVLLSALAVPAATSPIAEGCTCFRCDWKRQGVTLSVTRSLDTLVAAQVIDGLGRSSISPVVAPDGVVYVSTERGDLLAFERREMPPTGDSWNPNPIRFVQLWRETLFSTRTLTLSSPAVAAGTALPCWGTGIGPTHCYVLVQASGSKVVGVDGSTTTSGFKRRWEVDLCTQPDCALDVAVSSPTVSADGATVYVCTGPDQKGGCFAISAASGEIRWAYQPNTNGYVASPAFSPEGAYMYALSRIQKKMHIVSANMSSIPGRTSRQSIDLLGKLSSTPAVTDTGDVYVCTEAGILKKLNKDGDVRWSQMNWCGGGNGVFASPAIIPLKLDDGSTPPHAGSVVITGQDWVTRIINADGANVGSFCAHPSSCPAAGAGTSKIGSVTVTRNGLLIVPAANNYLLAFSLTTNTEVWRYDLSLGVNLGGGVAQAVASGGELIFATSDGKLHILGALPYFAPSEAEARINVEWTFAGVASTKSINADGLKSFQNFVAEKLRNQDGALTVKDGDVTIQALTRATERRAGTVSLVMAVCVRVSAQSAKVVALSVGRSGVVLTAAQAQMGASALTVSRAAQV